MADAPDGAGSSGSPIQTADTVVLKSNPSLIGNVERTFHDFSTHQDPLAGLLIFSHVSVPDTVLQEFLNSRAPPRGYIFVRFADEEFGCSLVAEDDVLLLSRCFAVGDTVKRHADDHMIGTVVSVQDAYILQPICRPRLGSGEFMFAFDDDPQDPWQCDLGCQPRLPAGISHPRPHQLLYNIPGHELKRSHDFEEGDHLLLQNWLGTVRALETDVAILLQNETVVWVYKPWELFVVIPNLDRSPVAIPEFDSADLTLPELNIASYNGIDTMQPERFLRGQLVVTNHKNLKLGRWIHGIYDPEVEPAGRVIDVRSRRLDVQWQCPNSFGIEEVIHPSSSLAPYENLTSFRNARDLRRKRDVILYDHDRSPPVIKDPLAPAQLSSDTSMNPQDPQSSPLATQSTLPASVLRTMGMDLRVGERVKFVDATAASNKYRDIEGNGHGQYNKISRDATFGFDLNEFKVISSTEDIIVQWQNQSTTRHPSTEMRAVVLPEQDLTPGDLVTAKEGMKQIRTHLGQAFVSDFNEMSYFEHQQDLRPSRVGVVQSMNSQERIARVRWFNKPKIELLESGNIMSDGSLLGQIGDSIEDVSLYEIMSFPALGCRRRDLVILLPRSSSEYVESRATPRYPPTAISNQELSAQYRQAFLSQLHDDREHIQGLMSSLDRSPSTRPEAVSSALRPAAGPADREASRNSPPDWVAEIVDIGLDGMLTVRFGALDPCLDVRISRDSVLMTINEEDMYADEDGMLDPVGSWTASDDEEMYDSLDDNEAIDEEIDYEGGRRMDDDSDDGGWITDEEAPASGAVPNTQDVQSAVRPTTLEQTRRILRNQDSDTEMQDAAEPTHFDCPRPGCDRKESNGFIRRDHLLEHVRYHGEENGKPVEANAHPPVEITTILNREHTSNSLPGNPRENSLAQLSSLKLPKPPPRFDVLSTIPSNQFRASDPAHPTSSSYFLKRMSREHRILRTSLPPDAIYVRTYESRLDLLRCLIVGPSDTPYELAPFLIDLHLGPHFPKEPPTAHFHSWTSGMGRINPNLYEEGKICLSLLGTWPGKTEGEGWSEKATILQVLVSLQGLVFVRQPLYNEAGFELYREEKLFTVESQQYNEKAFVIARGFLKHALRNPVEGLEDVLSWLYVPLPSKADSSDGERRDLLRKAASKATLLMQRSEEMRRAGERDTLVDGAGEAGDPEKVFLKPLSMGAVVQLRRTVQELEGIAEALESVSGRVVEGSGEG